ncbi:MAG: CBS domain-containing protein [Planctomycetes bacterium]|nr:CBS domain-containing protein [Planctomycetota bacterium]
MPEAQTELEFEIIELATESLETFCEDISGMFDIKMECTQQQFTNLDVNGLKKTFKKFAAVNTVKTEGALNGVFYLIFDKAGTFTLSGIVVMLPEKRIIEMAKKGSESEAENLSDSIREMGNLLVGSWDRIFRENLEGHGHFTQTNTFIGNPWGKPEESIQLDSSEELLFIPYEITIGSYQPFNCGVAFPKSIFDKKPETEDEQPAAEDTTDTVEEEKTEDTTEPDVVSEPAAPADTEAKEETAEAKEPAAPEDTKTKEETTETEEPAAPADAETKEETAETEEPAATADAEAKEETTETEEPAATANAETKEETPEANVSETIQKMAQSPADLPGENTLIPSNLTANELMQTQIVWGTAEDSVQQTLTNMQKADAGYILIGKDQIPEGIISKSDLNGAVSPYLKPIFAKWRRPLDDATLQIKIKWIMTRPVKTIKPDTTLNVIMDTMRQFGNRCLPVTDESGKAIGIVTVFDVFKALTNNPNFSTVGTTPQAPALA